MKRFLSVLTALTLPALLSALCTACGLPEAGGDITAEDPAPQLTDMLPEDTFPDETDDFPLTDDFPPDDDPLPEETLPAETLPSAEDYNIRLADWANIQWTQYQSPYFTLTIPSDWTVEWNGNAEALTWQARAADGSMLGVANTDHLTAPKSGQIANLLGMSFYLENGTVQELFSKLFAETTDYFTVQNSCVPANKDMLQSLRRDKKIWDYQSLYAVFAENGVEGEGIYSAVIMEAPDLILTGGYNYAMWEINGIFMEYAPRGELVNWQPTLAQVAQSFTYTDYYWQELMERLGTSTSPISTSSDTDPVMEAFEERSREDTILQEKRSDMIGEYERVYDNDSGNIYRAYNGFLDDLGPDQKQYTPITDSQYADGYVGWIEK